MRTAPNRSTWLETAEREALGRLAVSCGLALVDFQDFREAASKKPAEGWPPLSIRFAMEKAAKNDMRLVFQRVQKVMADWLKERGYLK